jgi:hypothetical protein
MAFSTGVRVASTAASIGRLLLELRGTTGPEELRPLSDDASGVSGATSDTCGHETLVAKKRRHRAAYGPFDQMVWPAHNGLGTGIWVLNLGRPAREAVSAAAIMQIVALVYSGARHVIRNCGTLRVSVTMGWPCCVFNGRSTKALPRRD